MVAMYQKLSFSNFILFYNSKNRHLEFLNLSPQGLISSMTKDFHWFTSSEHENYKLRTCCVHKLFLMSKNKNKKQFVYTGCSELAVFMFWTGKSMNNLLSYCPLVVAKISASEKDLPVPSLKKTF